MQILGYNIKIVALAILSFFCYYYLFYILERSNFSELLLVYTVLFASYYVSVKSYKNDFRLLISISLAIRFLGVFALPNLSQDYFRFFWDGQVMLNHLSPYLYTPIELLQKQTIFIFESNFLIEKMGSLSQNHFSNYPPLNQFLFFIGSFFAKKSIYGFVVILKLIFVVFECVTFLILYKLLKRLKMDIHKMLWYALNPLIILECFGNLHFESIMITFIALGMLLLLHNKISAAAIALGASVLLKIIPLLFIPLIWFKLPLTKRNKFTVIFTITIILGFIPFFDATLTSNYLSTMALWANKFEFNGSIYYVFRSLGSWIYGYNPIALYGKLMVLFILVFGITYAFIKKKALSPRSTFQQILILLSVYLFVSTTIHPWYLCTLIFINVFTNFKFITLWSYLVILSYSAYNVNEIKELPLLVMIEYIPVFILFSFEIMGLKLKKSHHLK